MITISQIQTVCGFARMAFNTEQLIIAGGAPRDILSGVAVKDIDVFVKVSPEDLQGDNSAFKTRCNCLTNMILGVAHFREAIEGYGVDICDIVDTAYGEVQIIGIYEDPITDIGNFDFDLSQVFVTPNGLYHRDAAISARNSRTITYIGNPVDDSAMYRSKERLDRLRAKYPDWKFTNCEGLDQLPSLKEASEEVTL